MKIVILGGYPTSGKDTFIDFCRRSKERNREWLVNDTSMVYDVKIIAEQCGWDHTKTPKNRKFLSDLKDLLDEWGDFSFKKVYEYISGWAFILNDDDYEEMIIFVVARQPEDIARLKEEYNATTVCIRRASAENGEKSNHADEHALDYEFDVVIENNGDMEELKERAEHFVWWVLKNGNDY